MVRQVVTCCLLLVICVIPGAPKTLVDKAIENGIRFMASNGLKYVSVMSMNQQSLMHIMQSAWTHLKNESSYIRILNDNTAKKDLILDSYLIIEIDSDLSSSVVEYVSYIQKITPARILLMTLPSPLKSTKVLDRLLKAVNDTNSNLQFYFNEKSNWYHIINIKNTKKTIAVPVDKSTFQYSEGLDLQGLVITDVSANYMPHNGASQCEMCFNNNLCECKKVEGIASDIYKAAAKAINVSIRHIYDQTGNWGLTPVSGMSKCKTMNC